MILGAENPYFFGSPEYFAWINEQAGKETKEKGKSMVKEGRRVEKESRAAQGIKEKTNPLVIAALVIGGGALLFIILKKSR